MIYLEPSSLPPGELYSSSIGWVYKPPWLWIIVFCLRVLNVYKPTYCQCKVEMLIDQFGKKMFIHNNEISMSLISIIYKLNK